MGGFRDLELPAFESGDINLAPEYAASMLEFLNDFAGEATSDAAETTDLLNARLTGSGWWRWRLPRPSTPTPSW